MATLKSTACRRSAGRLAYIFNEPAHNTKLTDQRVLACGGNIDLLTDEDDQPLAEQSGVYLEQQFHQVLQKAKNPKRKYQCQSIIVSFSRGEFDTSDLQEQAKQASELMQGFIKKYLGDTQNVYAIAADGDGGKLHCHLLVNTIKPDGKTVPTSRFTVFKLRRQLNQYLEQNFQRVTGRSWANPFNKPKPREDQNNLVTKSEWQNQLKDVLEEVKSKVASIAEYINELKQRGITITQRNKKGDWTYHQEINGKDYKVRDFYQRIDKETGEVKSTRGLGKDYTPNALEKHFNKINIKEVNNYERKPNKQDEEYERVKLLAREAKQRTLERQIKAQQNLQRLRAAKAEEKRKAKREIGRANQQRQQSSDKDRSRKQQQRDQGRNQQQNDGPEL